MLVQKLNGLKPVTDVLAENVDLIDESSENLADDSGSASHLNALTDKITC